MALLNRLRKKSNEEKEIISFIKNVFGYTPGNIFLYELAFRHKSVAKEISHGAKNSNERLEFLGDAILDSIVAEYLFKLYPLKDEGFLTKMRSKMVSRVQLNSLAKKLGLNTLVKATKDVRSKPKSLLGDTFEALIGAIYLDKGYNFTRNIVIKRIIKLHLDVDILQQTETNYKSRLIEYSQREKLALEFKHVAEIGVNNAKQHEVEVWLDKKMMAKAKGNNIKGAEQRAAEITCKKIKNLPEE